MKILYAIQATGNGHITRAREIIPYLLQGGELDLLVSGRQADVGLPYLVKYKRPGISYTFGKTGGIDLVDSIRHFRPLTCLRDVLSLPVHRYDLIISDFEPISSWACRLRNKACVALSHQSSFYSNKSPRPEKTSAFGEAVLRYYAPVKTYVGFHFMRYDTAIRTPVIRKEIRDLAPADHGHAVVYLPAHSDEVILDHLLKLKDVSWHVFSKHSRQAYRNRHVSVMPVNNDLFLQSLASCHGLVTAAGFESPAEALFLQKKLLVVPMRNQYEQLCNAAALKQMGVSVAEEVHEGFHRQLKDWLGSPNRIHVDYPDETGQIVMRLLAGKQGSLHDQPHNDHAQGKA